MDRVPMTRKRQSKHSELLQESHLVPYLKTNTYLQRRRLGIRDSLIRIPHHHQQRVRASGLFPSFSSLIPRIENLCRPLEERLGVELDVAHFGRLVRAEGCQGDTSDWMLCYGAYRLLGPWSDKWVAGEKERVMPKRPDW